jgi:signal transduction histidine kinase
VRLINSIAYHLGIAVGNADLFSQLTHKTSELERANKAKNEFLGVISHELRTPLNVINGYTELVKDRALGEITLAQERALGKITQQTRNLLSMINDVLQTTLIEAGAAKVVNDELNLCNLIDQLRSNYDFPLGKNMTLNWDYPSDLPVVKTDEEKLKATLQNLINNALKFTEKGTVTISVRHDLEGGLIEFRIMDTGIGIPKESIRTIFDMFQQVDSSAAREYGGVGLGLYIVKKFTELLGGRVTVNSELGKGSCFTVRIPAAKTFLSRRAETLDKDFSVNQSDRNVLDER